MERRKAAWRILAGKPEGYSHLEELGVDGGIVLRLILRKRNGTLDLGDMVWDGNMYPTLYICIPTNCTQLIYFINNTLKHMYCLKL